MTTRQYVAGVQAHDTGLGFFERYLTLWVLLCSAVGIAIGRIFTGPIQALGDLQIARINLPVAVLIWLMIVPMLLHLPGRYCTSIPISV